MELALLFVAGAACAAAGMLLLARDARSAARPEDRCAVLLVGAPADMAERALPLDVRSAAGLPVTVEPDRASARRALVTIDGRDATVEDLRRAAVVVGQSLSRSAAFELTGPHVHDIPWGIMHDPPFEGAVPPAGAPLQLWLSPRWVRWLWATPTRRAAVALGFVGLAAWFIHHAVHRPEELETRRGLLAVAGAPICVLLFTPMLVQSLIDVGMRENRWPRPAPAWAFVMALGLGGALAYLAARG